MAKPKRKTIREEIKHVLDLYDLEGNIDRAIDQLRDTKQHCEAHGYTDIRIDVCEGYSDTSIEVWGTRPETDKEYNRRVKQERAKRAKAKADKLEIEKAERKKLRELAKKYPNEI